MGGNATRGGVNIWAEGVGGTGIPFDIYKRLKLIPDAVGITSIRRHCLWPGPDESIRYPGGEGVVDPLCRYIHSLRRYGSGGMAENEKFVRKHWHGVVFEPAPYCLTVEKMLDETNCCTVLKNITFSAVTTDERRLAELELDNGLKVSADVFIDSTADASLAVACGCEVMIGPESSAKFGEPDAPLEPDDYLNATTLVYRVSAKPNPGIDPLPDGIPETCWWQERFPVAAITTYPNGDLNINTLPTMASRESFDLGCQEAYKECLRRILTHWHDRQRTFPEFQQYSIKWIAPAMGIRESRRVIARYILKERDLLDGLSGQTHPDIIAIVDHAMDRHGSKNAGCRELEEPYGIPYRCLLAEGVDNLSVASRAAGFSSIAASSCRLSRTMMQLGQAAGTAASLAVRNGVDLVDVEAEELRSALKQQHVQLSWPTPQPLLEYLQAE